MEHIWTRLRSNGAYAPFGRNRRTQAREMIAEGFIVAGYVVEIRSRVYIAGSAKYLYGYLRTRYPVRGCQLRSHVAVRQCVRDHNNKQQICYLSVDCFLIRQQSNLLPSRFICESSLRWWHEEAKDQTNLIKRDTGGRRLDGFKIGSGLAHHIESPSGLGPWAELLH
jgi:hypothetical protein